MLLAEANIDRSLLSANAERRCLILVECHRFWQRWYARDRGAEATVCDRKRDRGVPVPDRTTV